jgi:thiol-disulfide isomerase/thioredoxin
MLHFGEGSIRQAVLPQRIVGVLPILLAGAFLICGEVSLGGQELPANQPAGQDAAMPAASIRPQARTAPTPGEIYKSAMHPLDIVRSSLDNWSDAELGALAVGMHKAHDACEASGTEDYTGDDLYDLVRLCALGQDWEKANAAAQVYIRSKQEPHRAQAYALSINAMVHMNAIDLAVETSREMLAQLPYDAEVAYAVRYMKDDLEQASDPAALTLAAEEHPAIISALKQNVPLKAAHGDAVMSQGSLYESAMELAFWQRYAEDDSAASATAAEVDQAILRETSLTADDAARIAAVRLRYGLLGSRLPEIKVTRSLESTTAKPAISNGDGALTVLVLFPDWCGGCRKMMKPLTEFAKVNKTTPIRAFGLVFEDDSVVPEKAGHDQFLKELKGTSSLVVSPSTAQLLGADDFPFGIVLDPEGKVRFIGVLPLNAFSGGGYMEKTIQRIIRTPAHTLSR